MRLVKFLSLPLLSVLLVLTVTPSNCRHFHIPLSQFPSRAPGLQVDREGRVYASAGSQLCRLNSTLQLEEIITLTSEIVNISMSSDGRWVVVCLTDLSCEVYHATNFSGGHVIRRENVIISVDNFALFAAEDSFYVGGIAVNDMGVQNRIILGRYGFAGSRIDVVMSFYEISRDGFIRNFYGGFVGGGNAYYFVVDNAPNRVRSVRVIRVCHNGSFNALYELTLGCGISPNLMSRISGVSVADHFDGITERTVILSRSQRQSSNRNFVCLFNLNGIDNIMEQKFSTCTAATGSNTRERINLA